MLKDIIDILKDVSLRHKGVYTFRYQGEKLNNAQNNHRGYQVYVDDINLHELNITTNIFKVSLEIYVLGQPNGESGNTILDVQNNAYTIACDIMAKIDTDEAFRGILSVYDYSILTLARYTDDSSAGVKLSLVLQMPSPLNWCTLDENFDDEPHEEDEDHEIDIDEDEVGDIDITPISLPRNRVC
jgi:membrane protease subunit (stomatin/prohibitin family)